VPLSWGDYRSGTDWALATLSDVNGYDEITPGEAMESTITLMGDKTTINVDRADFYDPMIRVTQDAQEKMDNSHQGNSVQAPIRFPVAEGCCFP